MSSSNTLQINIQFPLADGRTLVQGPLSYNQDGLATRHNSDFQRDDRFSAAYAAAVKNAPDNTQVQWRVHIALWCAQQASRLDGDFVECGVHTGILSAAIMQWLDFSTLPKKFYLFDTWEGIPLDQISESELATGVAGMNRKYEQGNTIFEMAVEKFSRWPNAELIRGRVPEVLEAHCPATAIAFASIDLNVAAAEMGAIEFIWPRMVSGGMVLLDDYGWSPHVNQKVAWDAWAEKMGVMILSLPTGQGLIMRP